MGTATATKGPSVKLGMNPDEVIVYVDPTDPDEYMIYFSKPQVFGESGRVLQKGDNRFIRKGGPTDKTTYGITTITMDPGIREIPPK